jgi:hypothetical protein
VLPKTVDEDSFTTGASLLRAFGPYGWGPAGQGYPQYAGILEHQADFVNPHFCGSSCHNLRGWQEAEIA